MNKIKYILTTLSLLLIFGACREDAELIYDPNNAAPGQLANINASYVLDPTKEADVAQVFNWGAFNMGYNAIVTYTLQMDLAGKNFADAQELYSGNAQTANITVAQMNAAMIKLQLAYGFPDATEQNVEFRVSGTISPKVDPVFTNTVSAKVTPYSAEVEYSKVYLVGDFNSWDHGKAQYLWDYTGTKVYEGWIGFGGKAQNGFKITGAPNWDNTTGNWGATASDGQVSEGASMTLINGDASKNITCYAKNFYHFSYNTSTLELKVVNSINTLGIVGDGAIDWNTDVPLDFDAKTQTFTAIVTLKDGNIKFRADKAWSINFGLPADGAGFVPKGTLIMGDASKNIPVTAGNYKVTLNFNKPDKMTYKFESMAALDPNKIIPQTLTHGDLELYQNKSDAISWTALDFGGQTPTKVTYTVEMALKGTYFANAQTLGEPTTDLSLTVTGDAYLAALKALDASIALDKAADVDMRVTATVQGLSNTFISNVAAFSLTILTPPKFPSDLYMTGSEFGNWFGDQSGVVHMVPVNGTPGSFWCIKYFHANQGFKWAPQPAWEGGDFADLPNGTTGYTVSSGNAVVDADGLYMVYIDMNAGTITIESAKIYGMGNCFGGWSTATYPFTVNSDGTASITTSAAGELRMYATSSALSDSSTPTVGDWWRMEFIILDGKIVYRGNEGDQTRVSVDADKTITLDFRNDTGTVK